MIDVLDEEVECLAHPIFPIYTFDKVTKQFKCAICTSNGEDNA